jgi:hypothetical protein
MMKTFENKRLSIDLSISIFTPKEVIIRPIDREESLKGGIMLIPMMGVIHLFEAFLIVMIRIPKGIV